MYAEKTKVPSHKTRSEIEQLLGKHRAQQYGTFIDHAACRARVQFRLHDRVVRFTVDLPDPNKIRAASTFEQMERQRWRALLLVIKAKLEAVESRIATFEEEFLAHIVMPDGATVIEHVGAQIAQAYSSGQLTSGQLLLESGR